MFCDGAEIVVPPAVPDGLVQGDRSICDAEVFVWDDKVWVEFHFDAEAMAGFASAKGAVEGEHAWLKFFEDCAADRASHGRGVEMLMVG